MAKLPSGQYKWQLSSRDLSTFTPYSEAVEMTLLGADGARESNRNVGLFFFTQYLKITIIMIMICYDNGKFDNANKHSAVAYITAIDCVTAHFKAA